MKDKVWQNKYLCEKNTNEFYWKAVILTGLRTTISTKKIVYFFYKINMNNTFKLKLSRKLTSYKNGFRTKNTVFLCLTWSKISHILI